jgi:chitinase
MAEGERKVLKNACLASIALLCCAGARCGDTARSPAPPARRVARVAVPATLPAAGPEGNIAPLVTIESPDVSVPIYRGVPRTFSAVASDPDGFVRKVIFLANGKQFGEDETEPYTASLRWSTPGVVRIQAVAVDDEGARSASAIREYRVEECPAGQLCEEELGSEMAFGTIAEDCMPIVHWVGPKPTVHYRAPADVPLEVIARDKDGTVTRVEFLVDDQLIGSVAQPPYRFVWHQVRPGTYRVIARAIDNLRAPGFSSVNRITVHRE